MTTLTTTYANTARATAEFLPAQNRVPALPLRKSSQLASTPHVSRRDLSDPQKTAVYRPNLFSRLFGLFIAARQRAADREIARYLATTGGKMTDSIEREIQRRLT